MKIALVNPPLQPVDARVHPVNFYGLPLGLAYLAAYARQGGHKVKIFDPAPNRITLAVMWEKIREFGPDLVGVTSVTPNFMLAGSLAKEAKRRLGCLVVMGGPHVTALPRSTLKSLAELDAVVLGEGEIPLLALADQFDAGGAVDLGKVPGLAFMKNGRYRETSRPEPIQDLDLLPYPARDLVKVDLYARHPIRAAWIWPGRGAAAGRADKGFLAAGGERKSATILSSRGCPSQCTYCANICMGRKFRAHSPGHVVGEMEHLYGKYGIRHFQIADDCFTADTARVAAICDLIIKKGLDITWDAAGRVNTLLDGVLLRKMKKAGCLYVLLGIETGSQRINDLMKKGTTLEMAEKCCSLLRRHGIGFVNSFIVGHEGDTEKTVRATIAFARRLGSELVTFCMMVPYPGTALFNKYFRDRDLPGTNWNYWNTAGLRRPYEPRQTRLSNSRLLGLIATAADYYGGPRQRRRLRAFAAKLP